MNFPRSIAFLPQLRSFAASVLKADRPHLRSSTCKNFMSTANLVKIGTQPAKDHSVPSKHKLSRHDLPADASPLSIRWYFATDVPKEKPGRNWTPPKPPVKFKPFSVQDSKNIEVAYQRLAENSVHQISKNRKNNETTGSTVAVNEDRLFQVDVPNRELAPIYWRGPIYEVRRGSWFYVEGSSLKPCDENLATQVEEGFLKKKPFKKVSHSHNHLQQQIVLMRHLQRQLLLPILFSRFRKWYPRLSEMRRSLIQSRILSA